MIQHNLTILAEHAVDKQDENNSFATFLKTIDSDLIDNHVQQINNEIEPQVDCTSCGNCCRTLMINVDVHEANNLASHLNIERNTFDQLYIEKSDHSDRMLINAIPCHFLHENKCTVYQHRFEDCKEFPALDKPLFTKRLFSIFMHYGRCPIIYNVVEALKVAVNFKA